MNFAMRFRFLALMTALPLMSVFTGCGASHARYTPTSGEARSSLEAALAAWRDGKPYGPIEATPPVQVADTAWQRGEKVESFEISAEEDGGDGTKQFAVTLKMKAPAGEKSVRYVVHGRDPVWVYRDEDYKRMLNMDNNPVTTSPSKSGSQRSGRRR